MFNDLFGFVLVVDVGEFECEVGVLNYGFVVKYLVWMGLLRLGVLFVFGYVFSCVDGMVVVFLIDFVGVFGFLLVY